MRQGLGGPAPTQDPPKPPQIPGIVIEGLIGRGAMGVVYQGRQLELNRVVAVKVILAGAYAQPETVNRFRTEAVATARIRHPNIVTVYDSGQVDGLPYMVLEYLGGGTLYDRIRSEPQNPRWSAELLRTLAVAVSVAHERGVVHRDLKPQNVMFMSDGTPKITDYGLAKLLDEDSALTATGFSPGTPCYMAPEQAGESTYSIGPATDVYALGAILYELLTARPPFLGPTTFETLKLVRELEPVAPSRFQPKTPRDLETICLKCLEKDPARRYESAQALAADLGRFLESRPILARRSSPAERSWRWCKRKPGVASAIAGIILAITAVPVGAAWIWSAARVAAAADYMARVIPRLDRFGGKLAAAEESGVNTARREEMEQVIAEMENALRQDPLNAVAQRALVLAYIRSAEIEFDAKQSDSAAKAIRNAVARAEAFLKQDANSVPRLELLHKALHWSLVVETDHKRAVDAHRRADKVVASIIRAEPAKRLEYQNLQCADHYNYAKRLLGNGERTEAQALLYETRDTGESVLTLQEPNPLWLRTLGRVYSYLGEIENQAGKLELSEKSYRRSNELFRRVLELEPAKLEAVFEYATSCQQLQNYYGEHEKIEDATYFARETCRVTESVKYENFQKDKNWLDVAKRLAQAYYMMELQNGQNQALVEHRDPKRYAAELMEAEGFARKVHAIAEAFRALGAADADLNYYDCASCANISAILNERAKGSAEAREWLTRAYKLIPTGSAMETDVYRNTFDSVKARYDTEVKNAK